MDLYFLFFHLLETHYNQSTVDLNICDAEEATMLGHTVTSNTINTQHPAVT